MGDGCIKPSVANEKGLSWASVGQAEQATEAGATNLLSPLRVPSASMARTLGESSNL